VTDATIETLMWLVPGGPLVAAVWIATLGRWIGPKSSHIPCILGIGISFVCAVALAMFGLPASFEGASHGVLRAEVYEWFRVGSLIVDFDLRLDAMTALMLIMITSVSLLVAVYASSYMHGDGGYARFFAAISGFVFSMAMLVMASNFLVLFFFWEGVGLCSYLLIGYYLDKPSAAAAAKKAFVVNRIGDLGLILGVFLIWTTLGSVEFDKVLVDPELLVRAAVDHPGVFNAICGLLFIGAIGKSAQFPLQVWLPDAMEGPTPVSALIHAATMVTAGVYLVARCLPLFAMAPLILLVVAIVGALTAMIAALAALAQYDLKRVLAYSTVSQLGFMFMALGAGGADANLVAAGGTFALFHMFTHAFFKAVLFLSAGSVMHAMGDVIDMRRFSGLRHALPITHITFLCGALALAGFPLLAGFWSKDEILSVVYAATANPSYGTVYWVILATAIVTSLLTAFYTFRAYYLTFHGTERFPDEAGHHPHDAPPAMAVPLYVLAAGAVLVGLIAGPTHLYAGYLHHTPGFPHGAELGLNFGILALSSLIALAGIGWAYAQYGSPERSAYTLATPTTAWAAWSQSGLNFDGVYLVLVVIPLRLLARLIAWFDRNVVDCLIDIISSIPRLFGEALRPLQGGLLQSYGVIMLLGLAVLLATVLQALAR
jgi:NADH-quinone oxidoreductase subunit L